MSTAHTIVLSGTLELQLTVKLKSSVVPRQLSESVAIKWMHVLLSIRACMAFAGMGLIMMIYKNIQRGLGEERRGVLMCYLQF